MCPRVVEGLIWLGFAALAFALTFEFDRPLRGYEFGATGWPRFMILMIAFGAGGLLISRILKAKPSNVNSGTSSNNSLTNSEGADDRGVGATADLRQVLDPKRLLTFGLPIVYVLAMQQFGFLFVSPFFLVAYMYLFGYRRWSTLIWVNVMIYALVLLIFVRILYTAFPPGHGIFHSLTGQFVDLIQ